MPQRDIGELFLQPHRLKLLQELLERHVPAAEVWAYGSRVTGKAHDGSDLDLVLRNPQDLSKEVEGLSELQTALQESLLPILVETHAWNRLPQSFYPNIEADYIVLQSGKRR